MEALAIIIVLFWIILYGFGLHCLAMYAQRLGLNSGIFIILGIFCTPILSAFFLYLLGETDEHRKARILQEEAWKRVAIHDIPTADSTSSTPPAQPAPPKDVTDVLNL